MTSYKIKIRLVIVINRCHFTLKANMLCVKCRRLVICFGWISVLILPRCSMSAHRMFQRQSEVWQGYVDVLVTLVDQLNQIKQKSSVIQVSAP